MEKRYFEAIKMINNSETEKGIDALNQLCEEGFTKAQYELAKIYEEGKITCSDNKKAVELYLKAAINGSKEAQCRLGFIYLYGIKHIRRNEQKALTWLLKAAEQGVVDAFYGLGSLYENGSGIPYDIEERKNSIKDNLPGKDVTVNFLDGGTGNLADVFCDMMISDLYSKTGVPRDYYEAAKYYEIAASKGHSEAQLSLGDLYYHGYGVPENLKTAFMWIAKASKQNNPDAQYYLANMYFYGKGVSVNKEKAVELYLKSAENGIIRAQYIIGKIYFDGKLLPKSNKNAIEWLLKASESSDIDAQFLLGCIYLRENDVFNIEEAIKWLKKAAYKQYGAAQYTLGLIYCEGLGVKKDTKKGLEWFKKAKLNNVDAAKAKIDMYTKQ